MLDASVPGGIAGKYALSWYESIHRVSAPMAPPTATARTASPMGGYVNRPRKSSSHELLVLRDDREVDEPGAAAVSRPVVHLEAADVVVLDAFHRAHEAFAREVAPRAPKSLDHDLRGDVALERAESRLGF